MASQTIAVWYTSYKGNIAPSNLLDHALTLYAIFMHYIERSQCNLNDEQNLLSLFYMIINKTTHSLSKQFAIVSLCYRQYMIAHFGMVVFHIMINSNDGQHGRIICSHNLCSVWYFKFCSLTSTWYSVLDSIISCMLMHDVVSFLLFKILWISQ